VLRRLFDDLAVPADGSVDKQGLWMVGSDDLIERGIEEARVKMKLLLVPGCQCFVSFDDADEFHFMLARELVEKAADMAVFKAYNGYADRRRLRLRKAGGCEQEASYESGQRFEQSHGIDSTMIVLLSK
jgi:hypothetical protein